MSCSNLLWDSSVIRRKQIPTVQDALLCCDEDTLLLVVERLHASRMPGWSDSSPQERRVARKRMRRALDSMRECPVKRKDGRAFGLFPEEHFVVQVRSSAALIERSVRMRLVDMDNARLVDCLQGDEYAGAASVASDLGSVSGSPVGRRLSEASGEMKDLNAHAAGSADLICSSIFGCLPWSTALSYRIWLEGPWDCHERYMALADAYWQLTHQGFGGNATAAASGPYGSSKGHNRESVGSWQEGPSGAFSHASAAGSAFDWGGPSQRARYDDWARNADRPCASVAELRSCRAANMGLLVADALEESYLDKLVLRVDSLNGQAQWSLENRLDAFFSRRAA